MHAKEITAILDATGIPYNSYRGAATGHVGYDIETDNCCMVIRSGIITDLSVSHGDDHHYCKVESVDDLRHLINRYLVTDGV